MSYANWTPEQWAFVVTASLSALGGLVVTIISAVRGENDRSGMKTQIAVTHDKINQLHSQIMGHEDASQQRAVTALSVQALKEHS